MKRWALVEGDLVANVIEQDDQPKIEGVWIEIPDGQAGPGWKYEDGVFSMLPAPKPPPKSYSRAQLIDIYGDDYANILSSAKTDVTVEVWLEKFRLMNIYKIDDSKFIELINFLVTKNLITQAKADLILAPVV